MLAQVILVEHELRYAVARTQEGTTVRFHESSVQGGLATLTPGDEVRISQRGVHPVVQRTGRRAA
ncbi:MAG: hypothetical protein IT377_20230 [Polyangiaceae bacterium]|nr:hypothetical protein [Myxococcales bacterium]MCC6901313.1 hypothetical protein [Polyangiaceae bacterium]